LGDQQFWLVDLGHCPDPGDAGFEHTLGSNLRSEARAGAVALNLEAERIAADRELRAAVVASSSGLARLPAPELGADLVRCKVPEPAPADCQHHQKPRHHKNRPKPAARCEHGVLHECLTNRSDRPAALIEAILVEIAINERWARRLYHVM